MTQIEKRLTYLPERSRENKNDDTTQILLLVNNLKQKKPEAFRHFIGMVRAGYPIKKSCSFSDDYPCCCDLCTIKIVKCCDILYRFCCTII